LEDKLFKVLRSRLSEKTCIHSHGVGRMAQELALKQGLSGEAALMAGMLHDYAREMDDASLLWEARRFNIYVDAIMKVHPILLHGPVGAALIGEELGIDDPGILEAVCCHTCGRGNMGPLARIIYAADIIEPSRDFPGVEELRRSIRENFSKGLVKVVESTVNYVLRQGYLLHPGTVDFWNELMQEDD
jgi:predicted HD superfamily hydrolase involved in NAD metabolism